MLSHAYIIQLDIWSAPALPAVNQLASIIHPLA